MQNWCTDLTFFVNGKKVIAHSPDPGTTLLSYLRHEYGIKLQKQLAESFGIQCGFCSPGMVMSMYTLLRNEPKPSEREIHAALQGNLCRCTGYRPIVQGFQEFVNSQCPLGDQCCQSKNNQDSPDAVDNTQVTKDEYDSPQEIIFPNDLQMSPEYDTSALKFESESTVWYRPTNLDAALALLSSKPGAKIIAGCTKPVMKKQGADCVQKTILISVAQIPELNIIKQEGSWIKFGAAVNLKSVVARIKTLNQNPENNQELLGSICAALEGCLATQILNAVSVGGNVVSETSDLLTILLLTKSTVTLRSKEDGTRTIKVIPNMSAHMRDVVVISVNLLLCNKEDLVSFYKLNGTKKYNAAIRVSLKDNIIGGINLVIGGCSEAMVLGGIASDKLKDRVFNMDIQKELLDLLLHEMDQRITNSKDTEPQLCGLIEKLVKNICEQKSKTTSDLSSSTCLKGRGCQNFDNQSQEDAIGQPVVHESAIKHAAGESIFCNDMPLVAGELYLCPVLSTKARASIASMDWSTALVLPGVVGKVNANDVPGVNLMGLGVDTEVFASKDVEYAGQIIGAILAESPEKALIASKLVNVHYENEQKPVIGIKNAISEKSFFEYDNSLKRGDDSSSTLASCDHVVEGEQEVGSQEHFYMETQTCLARPGEGGEMEIISSTQDHCRVQLVLSSVLGVPAHKVTSRVKHVGGGFGGKIVDGIKLAAAVAVAAHKLRRPVRCALDRETDMLFTGQRHSYLAKYKVGFASDGKIKALDIDLYHDAGHSLGFSGANTNKELWGLTNAYSIPDLNLRGHICKTNIASTGPCRGIGSAASCLIMQTVLYRVADTLDLPTEKVCLMNMYEEGDTSVTNMPLFEWKLPTCWEKVLHQSDYHRRTDRLKEFNRQSKVLKRGIVPVNHGVTLGVSFLHQAGALLHVYIDGSILLSVAGIEIGQGLYTKMIQIASTELGVPISLIKILESNSTCVPNSTVTGASVGTDLNAPAVKDACKKLLQRLDPYKKLNPTGSWKDRVHSAYMDKVNLSVNGFYSAPDIDYNWETGEGYPYFYYTTGAAVSEVEIDCLTGEHKVLRTDIVMDIGKSLNPGVDVGQIEGAFMFGYGLYMKEELRYSEDGQLLTSGPRSYDIPAVSDLPHELNVTLLSQSQHNAAVYSSKAIGEPPLFLASSIFFATREAIREARKDLGKTGQVDLRPPATANEIRSCIVR